MSKRSKLERHRRRKSDGGSVVSRDLAALSAARDLTTTHHIKTNNTITLNNIDAGPSDLDPSQVAYNGGFSSFKQSANSFTFPLARI